MLFYIIPYFSIIFMAFLSYKVRGNGYKILFFLGMIPAFILVVLRGEVGVDTSAYIKILNNSLYEFKESNMTLEPFFLMVFYLKNYFELNSQLVLNLFSLSILLILFSFFSKSKHYFFIFSFLIFPIFLYDMSMNGMRYGMAFAFASYFISEPNHFLLKINKNKFMYLLSILNHKTAILFFILKLSNDASIKKFILICLVVIISFFTMQDYLFDKASLYSEYRSPSIFSGSQPLILTFSILLCNSIFFKRNIKRNIYLFCIQVIFYIITQYSYAGIRFQFLELFYILVILVNDEKTTKYNLYVLLLFIIGLSGFAFRLNNFYATIGQGDSPFLPYVFFWEE